MLKENFWSLDESDASANDIMSKMIQQQKYPENPEIANIDVKPKTKNTKINGYEKKVGCKKGLTKKKNSRDQLRDKETQLCLDSI